MTGWTGSVAGQESGESGGASWSANGPQMSLMLEFTSGSWRAYPYSDLAMIELTGSFLKLYFYHCTVKCRGRNLGEIGRKLQQHQIRTLREKHASEYDIEETDAYLEEISIGAASLEVLARKPM